MKKLSWFPYVIVLLVMTSLTDNMQKKKIIFFGDSITEAGVNSDGYIVKIGEQLTKEKAADKYDLVGSGISGNKVYDLYLRVENDVLNKAPEIVVIFIGVNDVWHKLTSGTGTDADKFEAFYKALIKKIQEKNSNVVLCTPAAIGEQTDGTNKLDGDLNKYCNIIRSLAKSNNLPLIDLRQAFIEYNKRFNKGNKESGTLTTDGVHLNAKGNQFVADEMWKVIKTL